MALNQIGEIASGVVEYDFDYITGVSEKSAMLTTTSGCLSGTLGQLNVLINQSFGFASGGSPTPLLQEEEKDILVQIYLKDYYFKEARRVLRGLYDQTSASAMGLTDWTSLREGRHHHTKKYFWGERKNLCSERVSGDGSRSGQEDYRVSIRVQFIWRSASAGSRCRLLHSYWKWSGRILR